MKRGFAIGGSRKITMTLLYIIIGIASNFFMRLEFYDKFLYYTLLLMIGFFGTNAIEHITQVFRKENSTNDMNMKEMDQKQK
jgi:uncharacterized membrane protein YGL010W